MIDFIKITPYSPFKLTNGRVVNKQTLGFTYTIPDNSVLGILSIVDADGTSYFQIQSTTGSEQVNLMGSTTFDLHGIDINDISGSPFITFNSIGDICYSVADDEFIFGAARADDTEDATTIVGIVGQEGGQSTVGAPNGNDGQIVALEGGSGSDAFAGSNGNGGNGKDAYVFGGAKGLKDGSGSNGADGNAYLGMHPDGTIRGISYIGHRNVTTVNAATYDLAVKDYILHVTYTGTGAVTSIDLKTAQTTAGRIVVIKDAGGNAFTNTITITTEGAQTIDGQATHVINTNYGSVTLYCDGSNWFLI